MTERRIDRPPTRAAGRASRTCCALCRADGHRDGEAHLSGMVEALAAMFEGLRTRSIRNPGLDRDAVVRIFRRMVHDLLTQTP